MADIEANELQRNNSKMDNKEVRVEVRRYNAFQFLCLYWKAIITIVWPLILLPVFLTNNTVEYRCMYVVLLMAGYWVTEAVPLPITSVIPIVLFPIMGIMSSEQTCMCYMKETNMMFMGGVMIAIGIEHSNLHNRIAMFVILHVGCSPRRLHFGLTFMTMFISMWISNIAATAMMCPIVSAVLKELEQQGLGEMYIKKSSDVKEDGEEEQPLPSKTTLCYYLSIAYAASIGGIGSLVGTGTNLTFKGIFETRFPTAPGINFATWIIFNFPGIVLYMLGTWVWLQFLFMGLFRPNSPEGKRVNIGREGATVAKKIIKEKYEHLGNITWHELAVGVLFFTSLLLWFFRNPKFIPGWAELISDIKIKDATPAMFIVVVMFLIPSKLDFLNFFSKDASKRPSAVSPGLLSWKIINQKVPWSLMFLLGGGFALAEGSKESGMSHFLGKSLTDLQILPPFVVLIIVCTVASILTEISANVAIANIMLPVLMEMCIAIKIHPLYLMIPATISCSFAFLLPVGTPCNAMVAGIANIPTSEMSKAGIGASIWTLLLVVILWPTYGSVLYKLDEFPDWAFHNETLSG